MKGWGLRVNKIWSDADWMESRGDVYFAVFTDDGAGNLTLVDTDPRNTHGMKTVRALKYGQTTIYWFFEHLMKDGNRTIDFDRYVVREVVLTDPHVDSATGEVRYAGEPVIVPIGTGTFSVNGKPVGGAAGTMVYRSVSYVKGSLPAGANVRRDTITNRRPCVDLYLTDQSGQPLAGATFILKDSSGHNAGAGTFVSNANGMITIAYLSENETYTLTQASSPTGYTGIGTALTIRLTGETATVAAVADGWSTVTEDVNNAHGIDAAGVTWWTLDNTVVGSGEDMRFALVRIINRPFSLEIRKTTDEGTALPGVTFALYRQVVGNNGQPRRDFRPIGGYEELVTGEDGLVPCLSADFTNGTLPSGTYYLYETYPLAGYRPLSSDVIFTVSPTGKVTLENPVPAGVTLTSASAGSFTVTIPNSVEGTVALSVKKLIADATTADENGETAFNYLAKLYLPDGNTPWSTYTGSGFSNGRKSFALKHGGTQLLVVPLGAVVTVEEYSEEAYIPAAALSPTADGEMTTSECTFNENNLTATVRINDETPVTLTFTNTRKSVNVTVKKIVEGSEGEAFAFTAVLKDGAGETLCADYTMADGVTTDAEGKATFELSHNRTLKLKVPYGSVLTITEADGNYDTTVKIGSTTASGRTVTLSAAQTKANQTVTFTNTANSLAPSGYRDAILPFALLLGVGVLIAGISRYRRRRRDEDAPLE
jgi:hypothetical protein